jgi:hypothetical protein
MSMKRISSAVFLVVALTVALAAETPSQGTIGGDSDATDVVVLLDLSQSILPYFQDVTDYVVASVVKDYLRKGDTFHLLSFGETAQSEIAQRVEGETDVKSILGRLYLLYPLARYSDFVGALSYLDQYLADLPESRRKIVVVITDGVNNPPPGSPSYGMSADKVADAIETAAGRIRANGWPVRIVKLPFPKPGEPGAPTANTPGANGHSFIDAAAKGMGASVSVYSHDDAPSLARKSLALPLTVFPGPLGKKDYAFSFPLKVENTSDSMIGLELDGVRMGDVDILSHKAFMTLQGGRSGTLDVPVLLPDILPEGPAKFGVSLHFANGVRVSPDRGILDLTLVRSPFAAFLRSGARVVLFIAILALGLAAILVLILMLRRIPRQAEAPIAAAVLQSDANSTTASTATRGEPARGAKVAAIATGVTAKTALAEASAKSRASEDNRIASAEASVKAIAASQREEAARSAALLAEAANISSGSGNAASALPPAGGRKTPFKKIDEHDVAIEASAMALVEQRRAEAERTASILEEASGRRTVEAKRTTVEIATVQAAVSHFSSKIVKPGSVQVELLVTDQNPHIGMRNVHTISAGSSKTVGGGSSDFLVFLVNVPRKSAEIRFDGEKLAFIPLRPEFFPDLSGPVEDCLGKEISMISKAGYPLKLCFTRYEKPADKINKLLHCIDMQG